MKTLHRYISIQNGYPDSVDYLRYNHSKGNEVHAHGIRQCIIHYIDILAEPIRDAPERRRVEEGHGRAQDAGNGLVQHLLARLRAEDGDGKGE